jgi:hypothetical protein
MKVGSVENFTKKNLSMIPKFLFLLCFSKCILAKTDCYWLRIIYLKMGGRPRRIPEDQQCCRMDGVTCTDGHITRIYWFYHYLTGSLPAELGKLVNLQEL